MNKILKLIDKSLKNLWIRFFIAPVFLLILWLLLSFLFIPRGSITIVTENFTRNEKNIFPEGELFKEQRLRGEFKATYDNLGIVSVRMGINIDNLENTDKLIFRIKEKKQDEWYYENVYDSGFFNRLEYSPFGFPIIGSSKGKIYEFEITSVYGNEANAAIIRGEEPIYKATYKYPAKEMLKDNSLRQIMLNNMKSIFLDREYLSYSSVFFLPFLFYVFYVATNPPLRYFFTNFSSVISTRAGIKGANLGRREVSKGYIFVILIFMILLDIFLIKTEFHGFFLGLLFFWVIFYVKYKPETRVLIFISLGLFLISLISIFLNLELQLTKSSIWLYAFLWIIFIHLLADFKNK
jgi:hypothetical protein